MLIHQCVPELSFLHYYTCRLRWRYDRAQTDQQTHSSSRDCGSVYHTSRSWHRHKIKLCNFYIIDTPHLFANNTPIRTYVPELSFSHYYACARTLVLPLLHVASPIAKKLSQVIRSITSTAVQNLVEIHPWGASGQIAKILTISRFLFIPIFKWVRERAVLVRTTVNSLRVSKSWMHSSTFCELMLE